MLLFFLSPGGIWQSEKMVFPQNSSYGYNTCETDVASGTLAGECKGASGTSAPSLSLDQQT